MTRLTSHPSPVAYVPTPDTSRGTSKGTLFGGVPLSAASRCVVEFLDQYPDRASELSTHEKKVVKVASQALLGGHRVLEEVRRVLATGIAIALKKARLDDVSIPAQMAAQAQDTSGSAEYFLRGLEDIARGPFLRLGDRESGIDPKAGKGEPRA